MNITLEQVREELSKDDLPYINSKLERYMRSAKASLLPTIGYREGEVLPDSVQAEFEELSNTYIVEYCRALLDGVDNEKVRLTLQVQLQSLLGGTERHENP